MAQTKSKKNKHLFTAIRIAVVVAAVIWAIRWAYQGQRWKIFLQINAGLFIGVVFIFIISQAIVAFRWWLLLRTQGVNINLSDAVRLNFLGLFYNNFMPSSVGGDVIRAWYVTKHTHKKFVAVLSVFVDRVIGLFTMIMLALSCWFLFMTGTRLDIALPDIGGFVSKHSGFILWFAAIAAIIVSGLLANRRIRVKITGLYSAGREHIAHAAKKAYDALAMYRRNPFTIIATIAMTVFLQSCVIVAYWFLGRNLGMETNIKFFFVFFPVSWVVGALPISIGGAGVIEGVLAALFFYFAGVSKEQAVAIVLCQRFVLILGSIPGMIINLRGAHLPKDFSIDYQEPII